ncbi:hypothetical protein Bca101_014896 [Brassica carinata]
MASRVEASTYIWRRRAHSRHLISLYRSTDLMISWLAFAIYSEEAATVQEGEDFIALMADK